MSFRYGVSVALLWAMAIGGKTYPVGAEDQTFKQDDSISFKLSLTGDVVPASLNPQIERVRVTMADDESLAAALLRNGIKPNGDAYSLVYQWNPTLLDESRLAHVTLLLPRLSLRQPSPDTIAVLTADSEEKKLLDAAIERALPAIDAYRDRASMEGAGEGQVELARRLRGTKLALQTIQTAIQDHSAVASPTLLRLLRADVAGLNEELTHLPGAGEASPQRLAQLNAIAEDLKVKLDSFGGPRGDGQPARWRSQQVLIRPLRKSGEVAKLLRAYFRPSGLPDEQFVEATHELSPNAIADVPEGEYFFWASDPNDKGHEAVTDVPKERIRVSDTKPTVIDLVVKEKGREK